MDFSIFRAYDIRGVYPTQISEGTAYRIARNIKRVFGTARAIVIGRDGRLSSPALHEGLVEGLRVAGIKVIDVGVTTWPSMAFFVPRMNSQGGIMITASHNPSEFNGFKGIDKSGIPLGGGQMLKKIGRRFLERDIDPFRIAHSKNALRELADKKAYARFIASFSSLRRPLKIVFDASNGTTSVFLHDIFLSIENINPIFINTTIDGSFPAHGPDPTRAHSRDMLSLAVRESGADFGVVFDGDGDRAVFVDERGDDIKPEHIWRLLLNNGAQTSVVTVVDAYDAHILASTMEQEGMSAGHIYESKVGHLFMTRGMRAHGADVGFEYSGHYYFKEFGGVGSGLLAAIKVANAVSLLPYSLSRFVSFLPRVHEMDEISIRFSRPYFSKLVQTIKKAFAPLGASFSSADGLSVQLDGAWCNVRTSNTQDLLRINIKAESERALRDFAKKFAHSTHLPI